MSKARPRVTEDPDLAPACETTDEQTQRTSISTPRKKRVRKVRPIENRKRCTIELTHKLDWILTQIAAHREIDKYDMIYNLIEAGIKPYSEYESCEAFYDATLSQALRVA